MVEVDLCGEPRKAVAEALLLRLAVGGQLVHPRPRRADRRAQALLELERRAPVMAVREQDLADLPVVEPVQALRRGDRVDEDALLDEVVRAGLERGGPVGRRPCRTPGRAS